MTAASSPAPPAHGEHGEHGDHDDPAWAVPLVRRAVEVYARLAYADGGLPARVRWALDEPAAGGAAGQGWSWATLARQPGVEAQGDGRLALRLGAPRYPNCKLMVRRTFDPDGLLFAVDTHDSFDVSLVRPEDRPAYEELLARNQELKQRVEAAWAEAGLLTQGEIVRLYLDRLREPGAKGQNAAGTEPPP